MSEENKHVPFAPVGTVQLVDGSEMVYKHDHIMHWFNTEVYERTINLSPEDKDRYFQMVTDYGDILAKLLNDDNHVLYNHIKGQPWIDLERHAEKCNVAIDYDKPKQLLDEYDEWKSRTGK